MGKRGQSHDRPQPAARDPAADGGEERYRSLLQAVPSMTFEGDPEGRNTFASEQWLEYTGMSVEQTSGFGWAEAIHPDDREGIVARWAQAMRQGGPCEMRTRIRRAGGGYCWFQLRAQPLRDAAGAIRRWVGSLTDIDDLMRTTQALKESEARYRDLVQNANSAIIRWRRDGTLTFFNEYAERFFGYRAEEVVGRHVGLLMPNRESDGKDLSRLVEDIVRYPARFQNNVNENICRDGRRVWMTWTNKPILDAAGRVSEILAIGSDITERKRAEQELRYQLHLNQSITDQATDSIFVTDGAGRVTFMNPEAQRVFGYSVDELSGRTLHDVIHHHHADGRPFAMDECPLCRVYRSGDVERDYESVFFHRDGHPIMVTASNAALEFDGRPIGAALILHDITGRQRAEKALRQSEERFQLASEIGRSGTWDWDVAGDTVIWSRGHFEILGYRVNEVVPSYRAWAERVHPEDRAAVEDEIRRCMAAGRDYARDFRVVWPDGSIHWMSARARYEYGEDGACRRMVGVMGDVTELKQAEAQLMQLNLRLTTLLAERTGLAEARAAHLRELAGELTQAEQRERDRLYELMHDHVQPLLVAARLALSGLGPNTPGSVWVDICTTARAHITEALEKARSLSLELNPPLVREQGLGAALEWLGGWVQARHRLNVDLHWDATADPPDVATRLLLFKAVRELLMNAAKHAGTADVVLSMERVAGDKVRITVADRGVGFDAAAFRAERSVRNGSGLGNIERRLGMIGGQIEIEAEPGAGTCVSLIAPLHPAVGRGKAPTQTAG